jgi:hypothetical protein
MTVEAYRAASILTSGEYDRDNLYYLASFVSGSSSWEIIDSWKGVTYVSYPSPNTISGRYKGDPITGTEWTAPTDLSDGAGMVIQQQNPRQGYPAMQICFQTGSSWLVACVSGHSYRWDWYQTTLSKTGTFMRVGTQGDWDLDDTEPDFVSKFSDMYFHGFNNQGSGDNFRSYFVADDDWLVIINSNDTDKDFFNMAWMGQYTAKSSGQDTVANPAYGILADNLGQYIEPDGGKTASNAFLKEGYSAGEMFGCLDEGGVWREWQYHCAPGLYDFLDDSTQPNEFDSSITIDLFEVVIRGVVGTGTGYDNRLIGSLRGVYAAWRLGNGAAFNSKQYMCLGSGYGVVVEWDGSTVV